MDYEDLNYFSYLFNIAVTGVFIAFIFYLFILTAAGAECTVG